MKTELLIEIYKIKEEEFFKEININHYDLIKINEICPPYEEFDVEYCNGYEIKENDFKKLEKYIKELKSYNFKDFSYSIITRQVGQVIYQMWVMYQIQ